MNRWITIVVLTIGIALAGCSQQEKIQYAQISTRFGNIKIKLNNSTPLHRDNFIKLAREGYYDGLLFHRVLDNFLIQGGDPDSRNQSDRSVQLGKGGPDYKLQPEIGAYNYTGAVGMSRKNNLQNPEKLSNGSQFYIIVGKPVGDFALKTVEEMRGKTYPEEVRKRYKEVGGAPPLDWEYTVFGEVVEGMEVVKRIASGPRDKFDRPYEDVPMKVTILEESK